MVKERTALLSLLFCLLSIISYAQDVQISVTLDKEIFEAGKPITGTVEVTHDQNNVIDPTQFSIQGQTLSVEILKEVRFSPDNPLTLTIFQFSLPGQSKPGHYTLPAVTLKVGSKSYSSGEESYQIQEVKTVSSTSKEGEQTALEVDAQIIADPPIYPGQHLQMVYTYYFVGAIELTEEQLPLLDAKGFVKIGQKKIQDTEDSGVSIRRISQEVRAVKPGQYTFPASTIEGYGYIEDNRGEKLAKTELKADIPEQKVEVLPFPILTQPASFNGAFGQLSFSVKMLTPERINEGDKVTLQMTISGKTEDWSVVQIPDLCCQPAFSGFFDFSNLPPQVEESESGKVYKVDLRALSPLIRSIPSIQFSFFDPEKKEYQVVQSDAIPLSVTAAAQEKIEPSPSDFSDLYENQVERMAINPNQPLRMYDLYNLFFATWWNLLWIPLGAALVFWQISWKKELNRYRKAKKKKNSQELYDEAYRYSYSSSQFFQYIKEAFLTRLWEKKLLQQPEIGLDDLPTENDVGKIKELLKKMEMNHYAPHKDPKIFNQLAQQAQALFNQLREQI